MSRRILLYKNGHTHPDVKRDVGSYHRWFSRILGDRAELIVHYGMEAPRPDAAGFDGIISSGSTSSLVEPEPWMDEACGFLRDAAAAGTPILGVCFGHQMIGRAWGGTVRQNPNGWEAGTYEVELTDEGRRDPLFSGVGPSLHANQSHRDEVATLGPRVRRLAGSALCANQAIAVGENVRGVQFHPEMDGVVIRRLIEHRRLILTEDAHRRGRGDQAHAEALLARAADTPDAERVVLNFFDHFVARA
jgi:GMP synthase (glutamine-hydrolysing)